MVKKIIYGEEARNALKKGIDTVANAVKTTLGYRGRFVVLEKEFTAPLITNDGVTIAKEIELANEFENMGADLVKEVAIKTNTVAGDGTTTATILAQALVNEGLKNVVAGANPILIKNGMEKAVGEIVKYIDSVAQPVSNSNDIARVGTISSRSEEFGNIIAEIMDKVGKEGIITVEESQTDKTTYETVEGLSFDRGYLTPYMATDIDKMEAVLDDPYILITSNKIDNVQEILPILEYISKEGKSILVISDDVTNDILATLVQNKLRGALKIVCVKAPAFAERRDDILDDIAIVTNGQNINAKMGMSLKNASIEYLGRAKQVKVDKDTTTIIGGYGAKENIQNRIDNIKAQIGYTTDEYDKEKLKERLAKISNGVAIIKVGATTEVEMKDKKLRLEDALSATKSAVESGIVSGGGITLLNSKKALSEVLSILNGDEKLGVEIVMRAVQYPIKQIIDNAGLNSSVIINNIENKEADNYGFDVHKEQYVDMIANGIIDPAKVTKSALQNALSVASLVLTTEVLVANDKENSQSEMDKANNLMV